MTDAEHHSRVRHLIVERQSISTHSPDGHRISIGPAPTFRFAEADEAVIDDCGPEAAVILASRNGARRESNQLEACGRLLSTDRRR